MSRRVDGLLPHWRAVVPRGAALPDDVFWSRHRFLVAVLALHAIVVAVVGAAVEGLVHGLVEALPIAALAVLGQRAEGRGGRWAVSVGLLGAAAALVHLSGGLIEMHFHFFVIVSFVALYRNWPTLLTTVAFVAMHHGVVGTIAPGEVYNHPSAIAHPWFWAGIHALLVLFAVVVCATWWRYSETAERHAAELASQQERAALDAHRAEMFERQLEVERRAIERLEELEELRRTFLQAVSHELRTPLTSIIGYAATLEHADDRLDDALRGGMIGRLRVNAERLAQLLVDLLDVDRLMAGREILNCSDADIAQAVARVVEHVDAPRHTITVAPVRGVMTRVDVAKFERIVDNLVRNAVKHTPAGAHVDVRLERVDDGILLTVGDDGPGIPPEMRERVFQAFEQGADARRAPSPGTGIGLSLVSKFAELHGGRAWVGDSLTGGACFHVHLPDPGVPDQSVHPLGLAS